MTISDKQHSAPGDRDAENDPVTRSELEQLKARRDRPAPVPELSLGGISSPYARMREEQRRAAREHYVASRLRRVDGKAGMDFSHAGLKDRAKKDFDRSR